MKSVGLRELKNRLAEYVREVRSGEGVLITDRGTVVAEIVAPGAAVRGEGVPAALAALARTGYLKLGAENQPELYPKLPRLLRRRHAAELLDQERGES